MIHATMWTYPWDVMDEGAERVAGLFKEELGLDAMSLSTVYHTYDELRPHLPGKKLYSCYEDAVYFQPRLELYRHTVLKPNLSPMSREENILQRICRACAARALELISWTVCTHNHYLARRHPQCALEGVFGDRYPGALCPGNPQVREYIKALSLDLDSQCDLAMIEYEALYYMGFGMFRNHPKVGVDLGRVGSFLMSLCFCEGCTGRARRRGVEVEALKARVEQWLLDAFERAPLGDGLEDFVQREPLLGAYVEMRAEAVSSLVAEVKALVDTPISYLYMGSYLGNGIDRRAIEGMADGSGVLCYGRSPEEVEKKVRERAARMEDPSRLIVGLSAAHPIDSAGLMEDILMAAYRGGARRFSYYNYGMIPRRNLRWMGKALAALRSLDARGG